MPTSTEKYNICAEITEKFTLGVFEQRLKQVGKFLCTDVISFRKATSDEDTERKCDIFLMKNGIEHMAFDVKSPAGIAGKTFNQNEFWFCPYDFLGNEKDISMEVKSKYPTIEDRYITFLSLDSILFATTKQLADWAVENRYPDFHEWKKLNGRERFVGLHWDLLSNFYIRNKNGREKILTLITAEELESIGLKISLTNDEMNKWNSIIKEMRKKFGY